MANIMKPSTETKQNQATELKLTAGCYFPPYTGNKNLGE